MLKRSRYLTKAGTTRSKPPLADTLRGVAGRRMRGQVAPDLSGKFKDTGGTFGTHAG